MSSKIVLEQSVVVAVDPHKASWAVAAVSPALAPLATISVPVGPQGYRQLRRFAVGWSQVVWRSRVPADRAGRWSLGWPATGSRRWTCRPSSPPGCGCCPPDTAARTILPTISVGVAALTASGLRSAAVDQAIVALRALIEHRDDVVRNRTQLINRLHVLLVQLVPGGVQARLTVDKAATLLRGLRPRATGARTLRRRSISSPRSATSTGASRPGTATSPQRLLRLAARWSSCAASARCWRPRSCPESRRPSVPLGRSVRHLQRNGAARGVLRRNCPPPAFASRGRKLNCLLAHHGHYSAPLRLRRSPLLRAQDARRARVTRKPCAV
jgi:hypothetical protein